MAAWALDAVDGWLARVLNQRTSFGFLFDKVVDRTLFNAGILAFLLYGYLPGMAVLILTKDLVISPPLVLASYRGRAIPGMGRAGKVMTLAQGAVLVWALLQLPFYEEAIYAVAIVGAIVGVRYLMRVFES